MWLCSISRKVTRQILESWVLTLDALVADYIAVVYAEMRADEIAAEVPHSYTTARTLLSILRLAQALARLRFAESVDQVGQC